jgi:hypothetical protein
VSPTETGSYDPNDPSTPARLRTDALGWAAKSCPPLPNMTLFILCTFYFNINVLLAKNDNVSCTLELHMICNVLLTKIENIEKVLNNTKTSTTAIALLSPNTNSQHVAYSCSPYSGNEDISKIMLMMFSYEKDLKDKLRKTHKLIRNATPHNKTLSSDLIPTVKSSTPRITYI